jgi:hypothetical protein
VLINKQRSRRDAAYYLFTAAHLIFYNARDGGLKRRFEPDANRSWLVGRSDAALL